MGFSTIHGKGADTKPATSALRDGIVFSTAPCRVFSIDAYNDEAGTEYLQVFDASSAPADTSVPLISVPMATQTSARLEWTLGRPMSTGLYVCLSTTDVTKTITIGAHVIDAAFTVT